MIDWVGMNILWIYTLPLIRVHCIDKSFFGQDEFGKLINSSDWWWFCIEVLCRGSHRKYTKGNGWATSGGREALNSRGKGTRREALLGGDMIE